jgi:hypothetical protein
MSAREVLDHGRSRVVRALDVVGNEDELVGHLGFLEQRMQRLDHPQDALAGAVAQHDR